MAKLLIREMQLLFSFGGNAAKIHDFTENWC